MIPSRKELQRVCDLTMEILRNRDDYQNLHKNNSKYSEALKASRDCAIRQVIGNYIFDKKREESLGQLKSIVGKELNSRPRKGQWRNHPKPIKKVVGKSSANKIGNKKTREKTQSEKKKPSKMMQLWLLLI